MAAQDSSGLVPHTNVNGEADTSSDGEEEIGDAESSDEYDGEVQLTEGVVFQEVMIAALSPKLNKIPVDKEKRWTPNIRALAVSAVLFSLITIIQVFAAQIAHSHALLVDCLSMGVDAFSYMGNICVECRKRDGGKHVVSQLIIVACSLSLLIFFTVQALQESWDTVQICRGRKPETPDSEEEVNGWITLCFALGGVGFDLMCLVEFYKSNQKTRSVKHVNMFSALLHVGADFLRSMSTLVMSMLILIGNFESGCVDAYTSIFICTTIVAGAAFGFFKWLKMLITFILKQE